MESIAFWFVKHPLRKSVYTAKGRYMLYVSKEALPLTNKKHDKQRFGNNYFRCVFVSSPTEFCHTPSLLSLKIPSTNRSHLLPLCFSISSWILPGCSHIHSPGVVMPYGVFREAVNSNWKRKVRSSCISSRHHMTLCTSELWVCNAYRSLLWTVYVNFLCH